MTREIRSIDELQTLSASIRKRLEESSPSVGRKGGLPKDLHDDLLNALDLLMQQAQDASDASVGGTVPTPVASQLSSDWSSAIIESVEESMALWQAQISTSYSQASTRELKDHITALSQVAGILQEQTLHQEQQREDLEREMASALRLQARLVRQRKTLAKEIRAQRAELKLEIERARQEMKRELREEVASELSHENSQVVKELEDCLKDLEQKYLEVKQQQEALLQDNGRLADENQELATLLADASEGNRELEEARYLELQQQFERLQGEYDQLLKNHDEEAELEKGLRAELQQLQAERDQLRASEDELESSQQELAAELERLKLERDDLLKASQRDDSQEQKLLSDLESLREERDELLELSETLESHHQELQSQMDLLREERDSLQKSSEMLEVRERDLQDAKEQLQLLEKELAESDATVREGESAEILELRNSLSETQDQLRVANERIEELRSDSTSQADQEEVVELRQRLHWMMSEMEDLREQNSDLASKVAKELADSTVSKGMHHNFNQESLSWEERKRLILQQLESESDDTAGACLTPASRLEIEQVVSATQREIERRDAEIEELREIVQMQSNARDGLAIGAAGIAQMLDSDDLINQEREKLRAIQQEWETKLRQAEIDLSMERAKLARERTQLEEELAQQRDKLHHQQTDEDVGQGRKRKWLDHLGLRDDRNEMR